MRLVRADTMHDAVEAISTWVDDHDAALPTCEDPHDEDAHDRDLPPADPALAAAVLEIESHIAEAGWDQPARLYALVDTARMVAHEPDAGRADGAGRGGRGGLAHPGRAGRRCPTSRSR